MARDAVARSLPRLAPAPRMLVPRREALEAKLTRIEAAGQSHLQVVFDFDHTLTRFHKEDGNSAPMAHDIIMDSPLMPEAFREDVKNFWADVHAGKLPDYATWWTRSHELFRMHGLRQEWLPQMVRDSRVSCREHCRELFELLARHRIPVLIASAGLTDVIREVFQHEGITLGENVRIVANEMHFNPDTGLVENFSDPVLHSHNKDTVGSRESDYFAKVTRKHVILVGDSLRDTDCLKQIEGLEEGLSIGLLNFKERGEVKDAYEETFDVVLSTEGLEPEGSDLCLLPVIELLQVCGVGRPDQSLL